MNRRLGKGSMARHHTDAHGWQLVIGWRRSVGRIMYSQVMKEIRGHKNSRGVAKGKRLAVWEKMRREEKKWMEVGIYVLEAGGWRPETASWEGVRRNSRGQMSEV